MEKRQVRIIDHPLITDKLNKAREEQTGNADFRRLIHEMSALICYECTRELPTEKREISTPVAKMQASFVKPDELLLISVLRAGNGMLEGMMNVMPEVRVGHIGIYRDPETLAAVEYYYKVPDLAGKKILVVDPMLATGHTAVAAVGRLKEENPGKITFVCLIASPEGLELLSQHHPDIEIITASVDDKLNEKKYIVPGLGDAGDRIYGTQ